MIKQKLIFTKDMVKNRHITILNNLKNVIIAFLKFSLNTNVNKGKG